MADIELNKTPNGDLNEKIKALKVEHKAALKEMITKHNEELKEFKAKQAVQLTEWKADQAQRKINANNLKKEQVVALKKFKEDEFAKLQEFKAGQADEAKAFYETHNNLVEISKFQSKQAQDLNAFKSKQSDELFVFVSNQKTQLNKIDADWKNELVKYRLNQFEKFHRHEDTLRYDEYLLEQKQNAEIDALKPREDKGDSANALEDADKQKGNAFVLFFKLLFRDIRVSMTEKPSIIFGLLTMVTGIVFGFNINSFIEVGYNFTASQAYVGAVIFIFELAGMLNMVNGFGMCGQRRLKSVVSATICTIIEIVMAIVWIYNVKNNLVGTSASADLQQTTFKVLIVCVVTAVIGTIGGYFTYDREYLKVSR